MALDPRTPVLVGAGTATQRLDDPLAALDPVQLLVQAAEHAAADAGTTALLAAVDTVFTMQGTWAARDAGRIVARQIGASSARSVRVEVGTLQTTVFGMAAARIASGAADVALVGGTEAKWRELRARVTGVELAPIAEPADAAPDEVVAPHGAILGGREIALRLVQAAHHYALIENARRALDGQGLDEHLDAVAAVWARANAVARTNPEAWNPQPMSPADIRTPGPKNKPIAFPYNKWHNSQWNVDQAAALVLCSVERARALGIAEDRWVFPHVVADSEHMVPVSERVDVARSPGFAIAGRTALEHAAAGIDDVAHLELYSCFPIAVRTQMLELGIGADRQVTCTGGMTWAGGPLNSAVVQQMPAMVRTLRADPGSLGLVNAISGMITKQGVSLWSATPPRRPFARHDVSAAAAEATRRVEVAADAPAGATVRVVTSTVLYDGSGAAERAVVLGDLDDGRRVLADCHDGAVCEAFVRDDRNGTTVTLRDDGSFAP